MMTLFSSEWLTTNSPDGTVTFWKGLFHNGGIPTAMRRGASVPVVLLLWCCVLECAPESILQLRVRPQPRLYL